MAELISISWGKRKSKGLPVTKTGGHHKFENSSSHSMTAAQAAVISELEQWVTQKAFLYFCLGFENCPSLYFCFSDCLQFPQTSTTAAESWFIWKNANSQIQSWKPRQHKQWHGWRRWWTSAADPVTHTQHYTGQTISSIKRGSVVAVWWNVKGILKEKSRIFVYIPINNTFPCFCKQVFPELIAQPLNHLLEQMNVSISEECKKQHNWV